ncbi:MAG: hypothetical protein IIA87_01750 [Nanoarchaeota archaeon]|nr:hypothetical protein [Nanoarchaeota archaeon]
MKPRTRVFVTFSILVMIIVGLYFFTDWFSKVTGYVLGEDEKIKLAQCLDGKNAVLYISSTCPDCDKQRELFGEEAFKFISYFECKSIEECPDLKGVPAWKINGEFYYGKKSLGSLQKISGCGVE